MDVTFSDMINLPVALAHPLNADSPMVTRDLGRMMESNPEHPQNAKS